MKLSLTEIGQKSTVLNKIITSALTLLILKNDFSREIHDHKRSVNEHALTQNVKFKFFCRFELLISIPIE